jgi:hypothetical protein
MKRREFFEAMTAAAMLAEANGAAKSAPPSPSHKPVEPTKLERPKETARDEMRYRQLGRTGEEVSLIGLGGHDIGRQKEVKESIAIIRSAIDAGINFMDNCWDYHDGGSEVRMGNALKDGYRKKVFLMTKIDGRTREEAAKQIDQCLKAATDRRNRSHAAPRGNSAGGPRPDLR